MLTTQPRHIRTGGDPRSFPDFIALRDEMSKQSHPARPDINWNLVETLSLSLFDKNGVGLQSVAWYTLARSQLARCAGMQQGLSILSAMLSHQWVQCWPQNLHARVEILAGLFQRLQKIFRTYSLAYDDRRTLLQLEATLSELSNTLGHQELQQVSQIMPLLHQVHGAIARLENTLTPELSSADITLSAPAASEDVRAGQRPEAGLTPWVYVIKQQPKVDMGLVPEASSQTRAGRVFIGGMAAAFIVSAMIFSGWYYYNQPSQAAELLNAAIPPLPRTLTPEEISVLTAYRNKDEMAARWLNQASERLNTLAALPPDWHIRYGQRLVSQANALWPESGEARMLSRQWQQQMALNDIPMNSLNGWHEGMRRLQGLTARLNALDGQKGKYITVSELKSQVFAATQAFNQSVPLEEQLRQISVAPEPKTIAGSQYLLAGQHLQQLIARYSLLSPSQEYVPEKMDKSLHNQ
ncbi:type VI secretion system protein VasL [Salmonella enterica subsp. enterica serovar Choleraesuis]|nr:type VI secretion system protein VasL [Salmonella enterica subsp. enterica serovar Choleraesuis]